MEVKEINGYTLLAPFHNKNAGFSRWTFGRRDGREYFLKEFQDPVFPDDQTLSFNLRQHRIRECVEFERRKFRLYDALNQASDGNLVRPVEFFRWGAHYYLATERIVGEDLTLEDVARLPWQERLLLCRTAAHALMQCHKAGVVHSDIKQSNLILQRTPNGKLTAKLIDFDAAFFEDEPPQEEEELHFDQLYLAPEGCCFLLGEPVELNCKMDVFSMGLLMHQYLTGDMPYYDEWYSFPHEAVLDGRSLQLDPSLPRELRGILTGMLRADPEERSTMEEVYQDLGIYFPVKRPAEPVHPDGPTADSMGGYFRVAGDL